MSLVPRRWDGNALVAIYTKEHSRTLEAGQFNLEMHRWAWAKPQNALYVGWTYDALQPQFPTKEFQICAMDRNRPDPASYRTFIVRKFPPFPNFLRIRTWMMKKCTNPAHLQFVREDREGYILLHFPHFPLPAGLCTPGDRASFHHSTIQGNI